MTTKILLAPVGAGKTESVLTRLIRTLDEQPLAQAWVLFASRRQTDAFRQRLAEWDGGRRRVFFNVEFFDFYRLYQRLLDLAGNPQRPLTDPARLRLLRSIIATAHPALQVYGSIVDKPGFAHIVADFIDELKQHSVYPGQFYDAATTPKDYDLARIYNAYQSYLQEHRLVDKEGQGWLALETLENDATLAGGLALLVADGFDQFTPVQAGLLALLAKRAGETLITLTTVTGREATVGRRFQRALDDLCARIEDCAPVIENLSALAARDRHLDLRHTIETVFLPDGTPQPSIGGVNFVEAPDPAAEVGAVLRRVKRLLLKGVAPDSILIALRDWERYRAHFAGLKRKYNLPLALHYGERLAENPAVIALLNLLTLHETRFHRRQLLDTLRSPYFDLPDDLEPDRLETIGQKFTVVAGREEWLNAVARASLPTVNEYGDDEDPLLPDDATAELAVALECFFDAATPPEEATLPNYVGWVEALIGHDWLDEGEDFIAESLQEVLSLRVPARLRDEGTPATISARDLAALAEFKRVLRGMLAAQELVDAGSDTPNPASEWQTFSADLLSAVGATAVNPHPGRFGQVLVTTATNARGLPHKHVFIPGLSEGLFPMQTPEDPLYLDSERQALQAAGIPLQTRLERRADDGLFYELICLPRESLTLSRPTLQDGQPWVESPLWRAVTAIFSDADSLIARDRIGIGEVVPIDQAATQDEAAISIAETLSRAPEDIPEQFWPAYDWLRTEAAACWSPIASGRNTEAGRMSTAPFDHYSGVLRDDRLIARVADALGPERIWSASQFNDFGMCPFRFFARRLLKLEAWIDPEEGMDPAQRGTINHAILERTYDHLRRENAVIHADNLAATLALLREVAGQVLADAPRTLGFRESALWEQEKGIILRKLEKLVELDFHDSPIARKFGDGPRTPYLLEAVFGRRDDAGHKIDLTLDLGDDAGAVKVLGFIDRIDQIGDAAIVIDYKTGGTPIPIEDLEAGRNFQMMVYLLGAEQILRAQADDAPTTVRGGVFWHIHNRKTSGDLHMDAGGQAIIERAQAHLARHIARGRRGDFAVYPSKPEMSRCARYCDFHQLCRVSVTSRTKRDA